MKKVGAYARYSSDLQNPRSNDDQIRALKKKAAKEGWEIVAVYTDAAQTGRNMRRPGIQALIKDAEAKKFDIILTEGLDRISRDLADSAMFCRKMKYLQIEVHGLHDGAIGSMQAGLHGIINQRYIEEMSHKVKRGHEGLVRAGTIAGGNAYGYDLVRNLDARGEIIRGQRSINEREAAIVVRIFSEYAEGDSAKSIATRLNKERVPGPSGKDWGPSSIQGNWRRGSGVLNNEMYVGRYVYNKVSYFENPDREGKTSLVNPDDARTVGDVPHLRIVSDELWERVKERQETRRAGCRERSGLFQRPRYLLSFRLKCGCCGGGFSKVSKKHYGCSTARNKGDTLCDNQRVIRKDALEETILRVLERNLMDPKLVEVFAKEYTDYINRLRRDHNASLAGYQAEAKKLRARQDRIIKAVMDGYSTDALRNESNGIDARLKEIEALQTEQKPSPISFHPTMATRYKGEVIKLIRAFRTNQNDVESTEIIRGLIDKVVLTPDPRSEELLIDMYGDLAGILNLATGRNLKTELTESEFKHIQLVAGADTGREAILQDKMVGTAPHAQALHPAYRRPQSTSNGRMRKSAVWVSVMQDKLVGPAGLEPATRPL